MYILLECHKGARTVWPACRRIGLALLLILGGPSLVTVDVYAQSESKQLERFRRADSYLRSGNFEKAIPILESLYQASPDKPSFYRKLKEAYESIKRYDDALRLLNERMGTNPKPTQLSEKARLLYQKGDETEAEKAWEDAISRAPEQASTYRVVYQTLVEIRRFKRAVEVLKRARSVLDNDSLFRTELAYLYGLDGQHKEAMREYVGLLAQTPERLQLVRNRLQNFVEQGEGIEASIDVLSSAVERNPPNPAYRELLAWLYMKSDRYKNAYDVYRALDRLQQKQGETLFTFAQKAADADEYAVATKALKAIDERHPESEVARKALRALGNTYREWAQQSGASSPPDSSSRYDKARTAYQKFLERYPNDRAAARVLTDLGLLTLDVYRNLSGAEETFKTVVSSHPETNTANEARFALARTALLRGNLDRARLLFNRLSEQLESGKLADQARFELALLHFYRGNFETALERAKATSANTSADVANDAISLRVLIQENRGPDSMNVALRRFAKARLYERQHHHDQTLKQLDSLLRKHPRHSLADEARFRTANVHLVRGDTSSALDALKTLPEKHPHSPLADKSLLRLGKLYEKLDRSEDAVDTYNVLLTDYPKSLYTGDARSRLRALKTRG